VGEEGRWGGGQKVELNVGYPDVIDQRAAGGGGGGGSRRSRKITGGAAVCGRGGKKPRGRAPAFLGPVGV
jgi:hypothetical protein